MMKRLVLFLVVPMAGIALIVYVAWGPLLVTSAEEALASVKHKEMTSFGGRTVEKVLDVHEAAIGSPGRWEAAHNAIYQSFFEGETRGYAWIVTYDAPGTGEGRELTFLVKRFTGDVSFQEPNWGFLGRAQLDEYLSDGQEGKDR